MIVRQFFNLTDAVALKYVRKKYLIVNGLPYNCNKTQVHHKNSLSIFHVFVFLTLLITITTALGQDIKQLSSYKVKETKFIGKRVDLYKLTNQLDGIAARCHIEEKSSLPMVDTVIFYLKLSKGTVVSVEEVKATFMVSEENKDNYRQVLIGATGFRSRRREQNILYYWQEVIEWK